MSQGYTCHSSALRALQAPPQRRGHPETRETLLRVSQRLGAEAGKALRSVVTGQLGVSPLPDSAPMGAMCRR